MKKNTAIHNSSYQYQDLIAFVRMAFGAMSTSETNKACLVMMLFARMEVVFSKYSEKVCEYYDKMHDKLSQEDLEEKIFGMIEGTPYFRTSRRTLADILMQDEITLYDFDYYISEYDKATANELNKVLSMGGFFTDLISNAKNGPKLAEAYKALCQSTLINSDFEDTIDGVIANLSSGASKYSDTYTNYDLNLLLSTLVAWEFDAESVSVYDPACGMGGTLRCAEAMLKDVFKYKEVDVYGLDIATGYFASLINKVVQNHTSNIYEADCLTTVIGQDYKYDFIVSDLPLLPRIPDHFAINPIPGINVHRDATMYFVRHILESLNVSGRAAFTCIPSMFSSKDNSQYLSYLVDNDYIDMIVKLPRGYIEGTMVQACICVLDKDKVEERKNQILVLDYDKLLKSDPKLETNLFFDIIESFQETEFSRVLKSNSFFNYSVNINKPDGSSVTVNVPGGEIDPVKYIQDTYLTHIKGGIIDFGSINKCYGMDVASLFTEIEGDLSIEDAEKDAKEVIKLIQESYVKAFYPETSGVHESSEAYLHKCMLGDVVSMKRGTATSKAQSTTAEEAVSCLPFIYTTGPNCGKVDVSDGENTSKNCLYLTLKNDSLNQDYLVYLLQSKEAEIKGMAKGNVTENLSISDLSLLKIEFPSLLDQESIVSSIKDRIDALQVIINMLTGDAKEKLITYRKALIKDAIISES